MKNFLSHKILPINAEVHGNDSLLTEFNLVINSQTILFYPSSGNEITDVFYANSKRIKEFQEYNPTIYIHSDYFYPDRLTYELKHQINYPHFNYECLEYTNQEKYTAIFKLKTPNSNEIKWLVLFRGYLNEEILKHLFIHKLKIPIVYAVCDGYTSGMGNFGNNPVPTIMYPLIADIFEIKYIITEQNWEYIENILEKDDYSFNDYTLRYWLKNILKIIDSPNIKDLTNLTDENLKKYIKIHLSKIQERYLDHLECYERLNLVLKKINV
jgi:hypothetical protein